MTSRSILLPPYMLNVPLWTQFCDAIDDLMSTTDWTTGQLRSIRDPYAVGPRIQQAIADGVLYDTSSAEYQQDLNILLKQMAFVGLPMSTPSFMTAAQALLLFRNTGEYWYSKGTAKLLDLLNFCLGSSLSMEVLWTEDYVTFVPESTVRLAPGAYIPITALGGTWYPTTHVDVDLGTLIGVFSGVPLRDFLAFFNEVFNYNLVIRSVSTGFDVRVGGNMLSMSLYVDESFLMSDPGVTIPIGAPVLPANLLSMNLYVDEDFSIPAT